MRTGAGVVVTRDGELGLGSVFPLEDVKQQIASGKHYCISLTKTSLNVNICMMLNISIGVLQPITLHAHAIICTANLVLLS